MKTKIIVRGPALSQSGYGEQSRFALRALRAHEDLFDIYLVNVGWGQTGWIWKDSEERQWIDSLIHKTLAYGQQTQGQAQFDVSLQVTIPNEWERLAPINVGYTAGIETTKIAPEWVQKSQIIDRIVVVSKHAKWGFDHTSYDAIDQATQAKFEAKVEKPIHVVNYAVSDHEVAELALELEHDFNYLCVAQWSPRKNLENTIRWFIEENIDQEVGLVVKISLRNNSLMDRQATEAKLRDLLGEYKERTCKVYLLHGDMSNEEMTALYRHPKIKCLVSLAHGEGFGLPIFEAAQNALPVIAVPWSGLTDFMFMPQRDKKKNKSKNKAMFAKVDFDLKPIQPEAVWKGVIPKDSMWAFARPGSYKMRLREIRKSYQRFESQAKRLAKYIKKTFTPERQYKLFAEAVLGREIKVVKREDIPKISIITSVYDAADHLEGFLEDITSQTIFEDKCELILINANSPTKEAEHKIVEPYLKRFPNIIYKKLRKDPGLYAVWNKALELASGEFITNANVDDRKAPYALERYAKELVAHPDVDLVYADSRVTHAPNETWAVNTAGEQRYSFPDFSYDNLRMLNMPHQCPMWRKSYHDRFGKFDESFRSAGDWELWLRGASQGSVFKKIPELLNLYYFNPKGISTDPENNEWKRAEELKVVERYAEVKLKEAS